VKGTRTTSTPGGIAKDSSIEPTSSAKNSDDVVTTVTHHPESTNPFAVAIARWTPDARDGGNQKAM
jgi:hypothetical protein